MFVFFTRKNLFFILNLTVALFCCAHLGGMEKKELNTPDEKAVKLVNEIEKVFEGTPTGEFLKGKSTPDVDRSQIKEMETIANRKFANKKNVEEYFDKRLFNLSSKLFSTDVFYF